jgi:hypothetical protein
MIGFGLKAFGMSIDNGILLLQVVRYPPPPPKTVKYPPPPPKVTSPQPAPVHDICGQHVMPHLALSRDSGPETTAGVASLLNQVVFVAGPFSTTGQ